MSRLAAISGWESIPSVATRCGSESETFILSVVDSAMSFYWVAILVDMELT